MKFNIEFSEKEISYVQNTDFLLTKRKVIEKIEKLLAVTRSRLMDQIKKSDFDYPKGTKLNSGKISKGENYRGLPWLVLDFPALFDHENVFAFRAMIWWGHFFSATLHLQGRPLDRYRTSISSNIDVILKPDLYISIGETPWQYHYGADNYLPIANTHVNHIMDSNFLKISKKFELGDLQKLPEEAVGFFKLMQTVMH